MIGPDSLRPKLLDEDPVAQALRGRDLLRVPRKPHLVSLGFYLHRATMAPNVLAVSAAVGNPELEEVFFAIGLAHH